MIKFTTILVPAMLLAVGNAASVPKYHQVQVSSPGAVEISSAKIRRYENFWLLSGTARKRFGHFAPIHSHIDLTVIASDGRELYAKAVSYFPRPIRRTIRGLQRPSVWAHRIETDLPPGSIIRVVHHQTKLGSCNI